METLATDVQKTPSGTLDMDLSALDTEGNVFFHNNFCWMKSQTVTQAKISVTSNRGKFLIVRKIKACRVTEKK